MSFPPPLFSLRRNSQLEMQFYGEVYFWNGKETLFQTEGIGAFPARSVLKPFQFLACAIPLEEWKEGENRYLPCSGSISANQKQIEKLKSWYKDPKLESLLSFLQLPVSYPMDEKSRVQLKEEGRPSEWMFHTCFSKHMGILESCERNHWEKETYLSVAHPYHLRLQEYLSELLNEKLSLQWAKDGCLLPTPVLKLSQIAKMYQAFSSGRTQEMKVLFNQCLKYPEWIGGTKRMDTKLMTENEGVFAKEGADGLLAIGISPRPQVPEGAGLILKFFSGYQPPLMMLALKPIFDYLNLKCPATAPEGQLAEFHYDLKSHSSSSWIEISPQSSFSKSSEIQKYFGLCQVLEVSKKKKGGVITELPWESIRAQRIFLKTGLSGKEAMVVSSDVLHKLVSMDVILLGVEGESVEEAGKEGLEILTGVHLSGVEAGVYELCSFPGESSSKIAFRKVPGL